MSSFHGHFYVTLVVDTALYKKRITTPLHCQCLYPVFCTVFPYPFAWSSPNCPEAHSCHKHYPRFTCGWNANIRFQFTHLHHWHASSMTSQTVLRHWPRVFIFDTKRYVTHQRIMYSARVVALLPVLCTSEALRCRQTSVCAVWFLSGLGLRSVFMLMSVRLSFS